MATLKIGDLSVGDWMRFGGIDYQVKSIDGAFERVTLIGNKEQRDESIYALHPILITAEILEKNGFRKNGEYNEWNIGEWNERPFIGVSLDRQSMRVKYFGNDIFIENKVVYVHQLQHALRLAGVDKEINL